MASHESAKKSIRKNARQRTVNQNRISRIRTFIKKLELSISKKEAKENIIGAFSEAQKEIMRGVSKRILHKNTASRKVSKLSHRVKVAIGEEK